MDKFAELFEAVEHRLFVTKSDDEALNLDLESHFGKGWANKVRVERKGAAVRYFGSKQAIDSIEYSFNRAGFNGMRSKQKSVPAPKVKQPRNVKVENYRKLSIGEFKKLNYKQQAMAIFAFYFQLLF